MKKLLSVALGMALATAMWAAPQAGSQTPPAPTGASKNKKPKTAKKHRKGKSGQDKSATDQGKQ